MAYNAPAQSILTVSQLNQTVRRLLESEFSGIWLIGEISNFVRPASGHWYFTLKDEGAQIRGAMFRGNNQRCRIRPQDGMQVLVRARLSLYEPRGDYQLIIEQMEPAGDGLLKQQFEQLKQQLAAQGYFAQAHKQPLPVHINRVGVITSHTGAAVKDIISVLKRRAPQLEVIIYPSAVQGQAATKQLVTMLQVAQQRQEVDVLIIGRGGGSLEDLWCFNEQALAQAIYQCNIPIVSAVGHEIDVTISDFVADVRAATPSAAAELISPDNQGLTTQIQHFEQQLYAGIRRRLNDGKHTSQLLEHNLMTLHPQNVLNQHNQKLDEIQLRLNNGIQQRLNRQQQDLNQLNHRFKLSQSELNLPYRQASCQNLKEQLDQLINRQLKDYRQALESQAKQLEIVSPLSTLSRGYSITQNEQQNVIRQAAQLEPGQLITTKLADGQIKSRVI